MIIPYFTLIFKDIEEVPPHFIAAALFDAFKPFPEPA
jgi:hypothetical protein